MPTTINKPVIAVAVVVLAAGSAAWYYFAHRSPPPPVTATPVPVPTAPAEPIIEHPLPATPVAAGAAPLPSLNDSDDSLVAALSDAVGHTTVTDFLVTPDVVRRIVVTIDNLPRTKVPVDKRPIVSPKGSYVVVGDELHSTVDAQNADRYRAFVATLGTLDMARLAAVYLRYYPLFQRAYEDLGYPKGYFNDRLVQVIDLLLRTPEVDGSIDLVRPNVMYQFADPTLEALPAGQKLLLRMGPDATATVKRKLKELRDAVTASPPAH